MTTICIPLFHHFILITLLLLYKVAIIDFLEELAYVRRRRNKFKKNKKKTDAHLANATIIPLARVGVALGM